MGYCEGGDLSSRLKGHGQSLLPESQVVEWFVQIALALQYLHERNILHRDLKASILEKFRGRGMRKMLIQISIIKVMFPLDAEYIPEQN